MVVAGMGGSDLDRRVRAALDRVGLLGKERRFPSGLSVGEQQRVAVARALANKPRLLLADEPTASVDQANQQQVIDLIRGTCDEENVALLMVTHAAEVSHAAPDLLGDLG